MLLHVVAKMIAEVTRTCCFFPPLRLGLHALPKSTAQCSSDALVAST